jgi:hypothetical protein
MIRRTIKLIREGRYAAEVPVDLIEEEGGWSPYLSLDDARKLDAVRLALRRGDVKAAAEFGNVFELTRIAGSAQARAAGTVVRFSRKLASAKTKEGSPTREKMPSATYRLFRAAILGEMQVTCMYQGFRELCPTIIGHKKGEEKVLAFQFGGASRSGLPPGGVWKCLKLSQVEDAEMREGSWHEGSQHRKPQTCVDDIDLDINIHVRKRR